MAGDTGPHSLRPATGADASAVSALVDRAYERYVERLGRPPGPMTEDYAAVIRDKRVTVAEADEEIVGVLVLATTEEGLAIENVAVDPSHQGSGIGRALLEHAEADARRAGFDSIHLWTHERMSENIDLYERIGYREYQRRPISDGCSLVFMRKPLAEPSRRSPRR